MTTQHNTTGAVRQHIIDPLTERAIPVLHQSMATCRMWDFLVNDINTGAEHLPIHGSWNISKVYTSRDQHECDVMTFEIRFDFSPTTEQVLACVTAMQRFGNPTMDLRNAYAYNVIGGHGVRLEMVLRRG